MLGENMFKDLIIFKEALKNKSFVTQILLVSALKVHSMFNINNS